MQTNSAPNPQLQNRHINSELCEISNDGIWIFNLLDFDIFSGKSHPYSHFFLTPQIHNNIWIFIPHPNSTTQIHTQINSMDFNANTIQISSHLPTIYN